MYMQSLLRVISPSSWLMMEFCQELQISPSQLRVCSSRQINALQILSDLSKIAVLDAMIVGAFEVPRISPGSRRFELILRGGCRCPVDPPLYIEVDDNDDMNFFFVHHTGPAKLPSSWPAPGSLLIWLAEGVPFLLPICSRALHLSHFSRPCSADPAPIP